MNNRDFCKEVGFNVSPDLITAYVGVGQALTWNLAFNETARLALVAAEAPVDEETIAALGELPEQWPPVSDIV